MTLGVGLGVGQGVLVGVGDGVAGVLELAASESEAIEVGVRVGDCCRTELSAVCSMSWKPKPATKPRTSASDTKITCLLRKYLVGPL